MASGMEAMMNALFRSMGFNPQEVMNGVGEFMQTVYNRLEEFDRRMTALETLCREIRDHQKGVEIVGQSDRPGNGADIHATDRDTTGCEAASNPRLIAAE